MLFARNAYEVFSFYKVNLYEVCVGFILRVSLITCVDY